MKYPGGEWADGAEREQIQEEKRVRLGSARPTRPLHPAQTPAAQIRASSTLRPSTSPPDMARPHLGLDEGQLKRHGSNAVMQ